MNCTSSPSNGSAFEGKRQISIEVAEEQGFAALSQDVLLPGPWFSHKFESATIFDPSLFCHWKRSSCYHHQNIRRCYHQRTSLAYW